MATSDLLFSATHSAANPTPPGSVDELTSLLDDLEQRFSSWTTAQLEIMLATPHLAANYDFAVTVQSVIPMAVASAVAEAMRRRNRRFSLSSDLPLEIWSEIWCLLPLASVVAASHVCSTWRTQLLNSPMFWTRIELLARPSRGDGPPSGFSVAVSATQTPAVRTSETMLDAVLTRSGTLPLSLVVHNNDPVSSPWVYAVSNVLNPHVDRLVDLKLSIPRSSALAQRHLGSLGGVLSALRTLSITEEPPLGGGNRVDDYVEWIHLSPLLMPAIAHIQFDHPYTIHLKDVFLSLRSISVSCGLLGDIKHIVVACPNLEELDIRAIAGYNGRGWHLPSPSAARLELPETLPPTTYQELFEKAARIRAVRISNLDSFSEDALLALFSSAQNSLSLQYNDVALAHALQLFNDHRLISGPVTVSFTNFSVEFRSNLHRLYLRIGVHSAAGLHREAIIQVSERVPTMIEAWKSNLSRLPVVELVFSESLWSGAREILGTLPYVETVTVVIDEDPLALNFSMLLISDSKLVGAPYRLPALRTLRLVGREGLDAQVHVGTVQNLVRALNMRVRLQTLHIQGIRLIGDTTTVLKNLNVTEVENVVFA